MSDAFTAVPEGKSYSEADVTKLMELQGVERDAAIGTLEMWEKGQGNWTDELSAAFPAVFESWKVNKAPVEGEVPVPPAAE